MKTVKLAILLIFLFATHSAFSQFEDIGNVVHNVFHIFDGVPKYATVKHFRRGIKDSGRDYTGTEAMEWFMQNAEIDLVQYKVAKLISDDASTTTSENISSSEKNSFPLEREDGKLLGIIDNPDNTYDLNVKIYRDDYKIFETTLAPKQKEKDYLLPGPYTAVLTSTNGSSDTICFNVDLLTEKYHGETVYWQKHGGTGNWGKRH